jgi:hypothetical protein
VDFDLCYLGSHPDLYIYIYIYIYNCYIHVYLIGACTRCDVKTIAEML